MGNFLKTGNFFEEPLLLTTYKGNPFNLSLKDQQSLTTLYCSNIGLETLPDTMINLRILICDSNYLKNLPYTFINLEILDCSFNNIKVIPHTYINLKELECTENPIKSFGIYKEIKSILGINSYDSYYYRNDFFNSFYNKDRIQDRNNLLLIIEIFIFNNILNIDILKKMLFKYFNFQINNKKFFILGL